LLNRDFAQEWLVVFVVQQRGEMMKQFIVDEYQDGVVMVFAQLATFRVTHTTDIEVEDTYEDCWDYARETHYTRNTGVNYHATTDIKSIELMLDDDVAVTVVLFAKTKAEIQQAIEEAAAENWQQLTAQAA